MAFSLNLSFVSKFVFYNLPFVCQRVGFHRSWRNWTGRKSLGCESSSSQSWSFQRLFQLSGDYPGVHPTSSYFHFMPKNW